jgi:hypothetical protein
VGASRLEVELLSHSSSAGLLRSVLGLDRNQKFTWTRMNDLVFMKILFETALLLKG